MKTIAKIFLLWEEKLTILSRNIWVPRPLKAEPHSFCQDHLTPCKHPFHIPSALLFIEFFIRNEGLLFPSFEDCLKFCAVKSAVSQPQILVIGGAQIYKEALQHPNCANLFITQMLQHEDLDIDTYFPPIDPSVYGSSPRNMTKEALEALAAWSGTGPATKLAIQKQLAQNHAESPATYKIEEYGYIYQFLLYSRNA